MAETDGLTPRTSRQPRVTATPAGRDDAGLTEIARGSLLNLAGAAVLALATLGATVLVARRFSRAEAGAFFTATSLFLIVEAISGLGAYSGLVYFIARLRSLGADSRIATMLRAAIVPVLVCSAIAAGLLLALADPLARALLDGHHYSGAAAPATVADALRALAAALPFAALLDTLLGASRGYGDMRPTVAIDRIGRSILQLLGVLTAALLGSATLLAPLWAVPYVAAAAAAWIWLRRIRRQHLVTKPLKAAVADTRLANANPRGFWMFTAPRSLAVVAQMTIQRLDIVLVALIRGPVDAAIYTAATRFLVAGQLGGAAISMAAQPQLSHLFARRDRRGANAVYQATTGWLVVLTWPLYLLAVIYGPEVLTVFGHSYGAGSTVMVILGLTMLLATACGQVDIVLTSTGRSGLSLLNGLLAVVVNVAVDLALIPRYGVAGAAIGWAAAIVVANLVALAQVAWMERVHPFGPGTLAACALCTLSFCVIPELVRGVLGSGVAAAILAVAFGGAVFAIGLRRFRKPLQLAAVRGGFPRPLRRSGPGAPPTETAASGGSDRLAGLTRGDVGRSG